MRKKFVFLCLIISMFSANAQYGPYYYEVGITSGPVFFHSDYGERGDFKNFVQNNGFTIGGHYYFTPNVDFQSIQEHFKVRADVGYMKVDLQHFGKYVENDKNTLFVQQLRAMSAKVNEVNIGAQIEYFPLKTDDYIRGIGFTPYISLGGQANFYSVVSSTSMGESNIPPTTPVKYLDSVESNDKIVASISGGIGTRFKLSEYHSLMVEFNSKLYFSDYVDGLNPSKRVYTENKANDWVTSLNFGYIYYFY